VGDIILGMLVLIYIQISNEQKGIT